MFEDFAHEFVPTDQGRIAVRRAGTGPPVLLLHGFPQTHVAWHRVAPRLAKRFTVVAADLPGYGESEGPAPDSSHEGYSKRAMARTLVSVMQALDFARFAVV